MLLSLLLFPFFCPSSLSLTLSASLHYPSVSLFITSHLHPSRFSPFTQPIPLPLSKRHTPLLPFLFNDLSLTTPPQALIQLTHSHCTLPLHHPNFSHSHYIHFPLLVT
ncbi:hypothetical protein BKA57DRAFT_151557 [Linnemannia elongata]|nr:hypothetical protein BKA57DRAFT_151557 [Linnemannia elongata]